MKSNAGKLKVLFDGKCHLCYREIHHYKSKDSQDLLELVDITSESFRAEDYGLTDEEVNLRMHVIADDGTVFHSVDAFLELWRRIPPYGKLIPVFKLPVLRQAVDVGYIAFARYIRPNLPKRKCEDGHCEVRP